MPSHPPPNAPVASTSPVASSSSAHLLRFWGWLLIGVLLWGGALAVRRAVLAQQTRSLAGQEAPFVLEAALQYRMTRMVYETGTLPQHEPKVQWPEGVNPWKTYSIGAEFVYAPLARLLPPSWSLVSRVRWVSTALFALAVPLAAFWSARLWKSPAAGILTGLLLAVSPAFVVRSSGLALSRENLAIPFLVLFLLSELRASEASERRKQGGWLLLTALAAAASQIFWDFSQYLIGLWALSLWLQKFRTSATPAPLRHSLAATSAGLTLAALLHPYLRSQGFLFSPVMILLLTRTLAELPLFRNWSRGRLLALFLGLALAWTLVGRMFVINYSHFGELLSAKIRFGNVKPEDPASLSYLQRIMWTPALNSSTWALTKAYFPFILATVLYATGDLLIRFQQLTVRGKQVLFFTALTLPLYVLFFRMHVFLVLFGSVCVGGVFAERIGRISRRSLRTALLLLIPLLLTGAELHRLLFFEPPTPAPADPQLAEQHRLLEQLGMISRLPGNRWGHPGQSYPHLQGLTDFLRSLNDGDAPVLAGFGISGPILAETNMPILLHPKFETPGIRERVREFYEQLFLQSESSFRDWAVSLGARYYVHGMGSLAAGDTRDSPRYMVNALHPPPNAAVRVLETRPLDARWFQHIGGNERYRVFRIITQEDSEFAATLTSLAYDAANRGDLETARRQAWRVLREYDWKHGPAQELIEILGPPREN